jgi:hypothetical protein
MPCRRCRDKRPAGKELEYTGFCAPEGFCVCAWYKGHSRCAITWTDGASVEGECLDSGHPDDCPTAFGAGSEYAGGWSFGDVENISGCAGGAAPQCCYAQVDVRPGSGSIDPDNIMTKEELDFITGRIKPAEPEPLNATANATSANGTELAGANGTSPYEVQGSRPAGDGAVIRVDANLVYVEKARTNIPGARGRRPGGKRRTGRGWGAGPPCVASWRSPRCRRAFSLCRACCGCPPPTAHSWPRRAPAGSDIPCGQKQWDGSPAWWCKVGSRRRMGPVLYA